MVTKLWSRDTLVVALVVVFCLLIGLRVHDLSGPAGGLVLGVYWASCLILLVITLVIWDRDG